MFAHQSFGRGRPYPGEKSKKYTWGQSKRNIQWLYCSQDNYWIQLYRPAVQATVKENNWRLRLEGTPENKHKGRSRRLFLLYKKRSQAHAFMTKHQTPNTIRKEQPRPPPALPPPNPPLQSPTYTMKTTISGALWVHPPQIVILHYRCITPPLL